MLKNERLLYIVLFALGIIFTTFVLFDLGAIPLFDTTTCENGGTFSYGQPSIISFTASSHTASSGDKITFSWKTTNTDKVTISAIPYFLPAEGTIQIPISKSDRYFIKAYNGSCFVSRYITVDYIQNLNYPWNIIPWIMVLVLIFDAIRLALITDVKLNTHSGNFWISVKEFIEKVQQKKPWGIVYDSTTKQPLSRAIIRLFNSNGSLIETAVSDANGVFKINPKHGTYTIKVSHNNYLFPSTLVKTDSDGSFTHIYHGETISISSDNQPLLISIPLDPAEIGQVSRVFRTTAIGFENFFRSGSLVGITFGFSLSITYAIYYPNTITILVLIVFAALTGIKVLPTLNKQKDSGIVKDKDGNIIPNVELGIFEDDFNTLVSRTFTDSAGKYNFIVPRQPYHIQIMDEQYSLYSKTATNLGEPVITNASSDDPFIYVTQDLLVGPRKSPDMPIT